jgi:hypothetical protein
VVQGIWNLRDAFKAGDAGARLPPGATPGRTQNDGY